jgi:hypothetical protein
MIMGLWFYALVQCVFAICYAIAFGKIGNPDWDNINKPTEKWAIDHPKWTIFFLLVLSTAFVILTVAASHLGFFRPLYDSLLTVIATGFTLMLIAGNRKAPRTNRYPYLQKKVWIVSLLIAVGLFVAVRTWWSLLPVLPAILAMITWATDSATQLDSPNTFDDDKQRRGFVFLLVSVLLLWSVLTWIPAVGNLFPHPFDTSAYTPASVTSTPAPSPTPDPLRDQFNSILDQVESGIPSNCAQPNPAGEFGVWAAFKGVSQDTLNQMKTNGYFDGNNNRGLKLDFTKVQQGFDAYNANPVPPGQWVATYPDSMSQCGDTPTPVNPGSTPTAP